MKICVSRLSRSKFHEGMWPSFASRDGSPAPREDNPLKRLRNWNGFAFNWRDYSYWIEFRRHTPHPPRRRYG